MKLRQRLIVSWTLLTGVSLMGAFAGVSALFDYSQRKELDDSLLRVATMEAQEAPLFNFRFSAHPGPAKSDVGPLRDFGVIYAEDGHPMAATPPFDESPPELRHLNHALGKPFDITVDDSQLRAVLLAIPAAPDRRVLIAHSRETLDTTSRFLHRAMFVAFIVSVAWSTVLVVWMVRRQTRHHENIAAVARRVASGDLDARVTARDADFEEAQLGRDIDQMIDQLSGLLTSQTRFIANAAHELRSPIAVVCGELQQTLRKPRDSAAYREGIERALGGARRLSSLADDLLTLVRPSNVSKTSTQVGDLVEAAIEPLRELSPTKQLGLSLEPGLSERQVCGQPSDLERLFRNLVENALRHAATRVDVRGSVHGDQIEIAVSDDGPGVAVEDRDRIFDPFFRAPKTRAGSPGGAGLGLAIARDIARAHRGDVQLSSPEAGTGACFVVSLPLGASASASAEA